MNTNLTAGSPVDITLKKKRDNIFTKMKSFFVKNPRSASSFKKFSTIKKVKRGSFLRSNASKVIFRVLGVLFILFFSIAFIGGIAGSIFAMGYVGKIKANLPDAGKLAQRDMEMSTKIFDRKGKLLYTVYGDFNREFTPLNKFPKHTKWAVLAAEDIEFYNHKGIDPVGITAAIYQYVKFGYARGASTITQQVARNTVLFQLLKAEAFEVSAQRKIKEMLISIEMEKKLSKDQILEIYLNEIGLGGPNYGFQTAARAYFNKDVSDLTLGESAFLAGSIHMPNTYYMAMKNNDSEVGTTRRNIILDLMLKHKDKFKDEFEITNEIVEKAKKEPLVFTPGQINISAPHFVFYTLERLEALLGKKYGKNEASAMIKNGGLRVTTTIDLDTQKIAEQELKNQINNYKTWYGAHNGAVVVLDPKNSQILAMVGSVDYNNTKDKRVDGNVNVAVMPRQMGSSVKPYVYLAAFQKGYNPGTPAPDIKMSFGNYKVDNWNKKFEGWLSAKDALNLSRNIPAVYMLQTIGGTEEFIKIAEKMGITTLTERNRYGLSLAIGAADIKLLEHTNAFGIWANNGVYHEPTSILKIEDYKGTEIYKNDVKETEKRIFTEQEMWLQNWTLCNMNDGQKLAKGFYTASGQKLCGKTGTTDGPVDLVAILYYPKLVVGVWTGNNNRKKTYGTRGQGWSENVPLPIANAIMRRLVPKYGQAWYTQPSGVSKATVCQYTGLLKKEGNPCKGIETYIITSQTPAVDTAHKKFRVCAINGLLPLNPEEAEANGQLKDVVYFDYTYPNKFQDKTLKDYVSKKYPIYTADPESAVCPITYPVPQITINSPVANTTYTAGSKLNISASIASQNTLQQVIILFEDSIIKTVSTNTVSYEYTLSETLEEHEYTITIKALDNKGQEGVATVNINVVKPTPTPTESVAPT